MSETALENGVTTVDQLESTPSGLVRRWLSEWEIADKAEKTWRACVGQWEKVSAFFSEEEISAIQEIN